MVDWVNLAAIGVAALALCVSIWAVWQTRQTAHANIVLVFLKDYASKEMSDHLEELKKFDDEGGTLLDVLAQYRFDNEYEFVAKKYVDEFEPALGSSRRHVSNFYNRAWRLHQNSYLSKRALRIIASTNGFALLSRVIEPIAPATHLIKICGGDMRKFQGELDKFYWFKDFRKAVK